MRPDSDGTTGAGIGLRAVLTEGNFTGATCRLDLLPGAHAAEIVVVDISARILEDGLKNFPSHNGSFSDLF